MKNFLFCFQLIFFVGLNVFAKEKPETKADSLSYSMGMSMANIYNQNKIEGFNVVIFNEAFKEMLSSENPNTYWDIETAKNMIQQFFQEKLKKVTEENLMKGETFLKENKKRENIITLESGLQYEILKKGGGEKPTPKNKISVHYVGMHLDGSIFSSTLKTGNPLIFNLSEMIDGWTEVLQLMPLGSKWRVYIPTHLAYSELGAGDQIQPNETLIFEIELLEIVK